MALKPRRGGLALGLVLVGLNLILVNLIAARHWFRTDWSRGGRFSLSPKTIEVLRGVQRPIQVHVFMTPPARFQDSVYHETRELLRRFSRHAPMIRVEFVDIDADPTRARLLARKHSINAADLRQGVVLIESAGRSRYVPARSMAEYQASDGLMKLVELRGEAALLEALLAVTTERIQTVCFTRDHGEFSAESYAEAGYGFIADEVRRDTFRTKSVGMQDLMAGARDCDLLVIGGPRRAFAPVELDALDRFIRRKGRLLLLLGPVLDRKVTRHLRTGLEELLTRWGIQVLDNIVVDHLAVPGEQPYMTWATRDGYGSHPIARSMAGKLTVWPLTREVRPAASGTRPDLVVASLVRTSHKGWAETDLESLWGRRPLRLDQAVDSAGPVSVAVAASWRDSRIVVVGSDQGVLNKRINTLQIRDFNRDFFMSCINWLAGQRSRIAVGPKVPEQMHLVLDERQLSLAFLICVVGLPLIGLCGGLVVWWRRRR